MIAGQRPKPALLKVITGNPGRHPIQNEPVSPPIGGVPRHLSPEMRKAWREIAGRVPKNILKRADEALLELAAAMMVRFRADPLGQSPAFLAQYRAALGELGLTPSARARLPGEPPPTKDPFDGIC